MTPEFQAYVECEKCKCRKWHKHMFPVERDCGELGMRTVYYCYGKDCGEDAANADTLEVLGRAML